MLTVGKELARVGGKLRALFEMFEADRQLAEQQWLKNLRQYMGKYDPTTLEKIPDDKSKAYPRDTRVKVKGGVAKMMEMMFPAQERNWELAISPSPSIPETELTAILENLQSQTDQETGEPVPFDGDDIEREIRAFATVRKNRMETEIADQLADKRVDYPQMVKRAVRSGYIYGAGIARSPLVRTQTERVWEMDKRTGAYVAKKKKERRPYPEFVRIWDCYPDMMAKTWEDQEMFFERFVLTRHDLRKLANRPDFEDKVITEYIAENPRGNYVAKSYETELQELAKTTNVADRTSRRYEAYRVIGFVSGHDLKDAGVEVDEKDLTDDIFAEFWIIDNVVIKADKAAFGDRVSDQYHAFIYTEDEDSGLTGIGLPEEIRDSQLSLCAATRALMDNMASIAGPIFEVNKALMHRGQVPGAIYAFQVIEREGEGHEAQYPAVRDITTQSHVTEILSIIQMLRQQLDVESNLPAFTMGAMQQPLGEAFRTSNNMSMMMGSANMVTKDTVRAFDKFTTGVVGSLLRWNMEFNPREEIKGDFHVRAKGNLSLVAKEVRGAALDQFIMTLTQEERAILDTYGVLVDRLKARDLSTDRLMPEDEAKQVLQSMREASSQASQIEQGLTEARTADAQASAAKKQADAQKTTETIPALIEEMMSRIEMNMATAQTQAEKMQLENLRTLLSTATQQPATGVQ